MAQIKNLFSLVCLTLAIVSIIFSMSNMLYQYYNFCLVREFYFGFIFDEVLLFCSQLSLLCYIEFFFIIIQMV